MGEPEQPIRKFIRRGVFNHAMFFWVLALRTNLPSISIKDAIKNFVKCNGFITDDAVDDAKLASLSVEYERIYKEYMDEYKEQQRKKE